MSFRHYDLVEAQLSSRQRTLLRRALARLDEDIRKSPAKYSKKYGIQSDKTLKTHLTDIENIESKLNLY